MPATALSLSLLIFLFIYFLQLLVKENNDRALTQLCLTTISFSIDLSQVGGREEAPVDHADTLRTSLGLFRGDHVA